MATFFKHQKNTSERGAAMMIAVIFFILASTLLVLGLAAPAAREYRIGTDAVASRKSFSAGESGVEDAYYRIKNSIPLGTSTFLRAGTAAAIIWFGRIDASSGLSVSKRQPFSLFQNFW